MPVIKNDFTFIPEELIKATRTGIISYAALGILIDMLSRPNNGVAHKDFYKNKSYDIRAINKIFKELQVAGYLKIEGLLKNGKIIDKVWHVSNKPIYKTTIKIK